MYDIPWRVCEKTLRPNYSFAELLVSSKKCYSITCGCGMCKY